MAIIAFFAVNLLFTTYVVGQTSRLSSACRRPRRSIWMAASPTEGPCRHEVGGAGGEPEGFSVPIRIVCWD